MTTQHAIETAAFTLLALLGAAALTPNRPSATTAAPSTTGNVQPEGDGAAAPVPLTPADAAGSSLAPAVAPPVAAAGVFNTPIYDALALASEVTAMRDELRQMRAKQQSADCAACAPAARYTAQPTYQRRYLLRPWRR